MAANDRCGIPFFEAVIDVDSATIGGRPVFKVGGVAVLASGGPNMTVIGVGGSDGLVLCAWMDGYVCHRAEFPAKALRRADS